jgi:hypothetical protein
MCTVFIVKSYFMYYAVRDSEPSAVAEEGAVDSIEANVNITDEEKEQRLALGEYISDFYISDHCF